MPLNEMQKETIKNTFGVFINSIHMWSRSEDKSLALAALNIIEAASYPNIQEQRFLTRCTYGDGENLFTACMAVRQILDHPYPQELLGLCRNDNVLVNHYPTVPPSAQEVKDYLRAHIENQKIEMNRNYKVHAATVPFVNLDHQGMKELSEDIKQGVEKFVKKKEKSLPMAACLILLGLSYAYKDNIKTSSLVFKLYMGMEEYPLHFAISNGLANMIKPLVAAGADINVRDKDGYTPLCYAAKEGNKDIMQKLLDAGADINVRDEDGYYTPLGNAAKEGHKDIVQMLLNAGADVNAKQDDGHTPLCYAANGGHKDVVQTLLNAGADVNAEVFLDRPAALMCTLFR